ncbi:MAG TPA: hypothetical protein PKM63_22360, partial [Panacibacter sp.]|nr:hypothetical protein [Panacibacter sp.]HNP47057.1 hypothetical protein [Panacibacter sp.]
MHHTTENNGFVFMGTIGGTLSGLCNAISGHGVLQTAVYSAVGAFVSFTVSYVLNRMIRKRDDKS